MYVHISESMSMPQTIQCNHSTTTAGGPPSNWENEEDICKWVGVDQYQWFWSHSSLEPLISVFGDLSAGGSIKHFIIPCVFSAISETRNNISWKRKVKVVLSWASQLLLAQVISYICHNNQSVRRSGYLNLNKSQQSGFSFTFHYRFSKY